MSLAGGCKKAKAPGEQDNPASGGGGGAPAGSGGGGGGGGGATAKAGGGGGGGGGAAAGADDEALIEKLGKYIDCINSVSNRAMDSRQRYYSWLKDPEKGPQGNERNVYGLYTLNDPKSCLTGLDEALGMDPKLAGLDAAGTAYKNAITKLLPLIKSANDYYEQDDYKDDKFAKAKEMHGPLFAAFEDFAKSNASMRSELEKVDEGLKERELARMEAEMGRNLQFTQANVMRYAKVLLRAGMDDQPVVEELEGALGNYQKAHQEMTDVLAKDPGQTEHVFMWSSFESGAKDFLIAAKERFRRVRDKVPYSTGEKMNLGGSGEWMVNGSPGKLLNEYNDLVDSSNRLKWGWP